MAALLETTDARDRFAAWLAAALGCDVAVAAVAAPSSAGGWSNDTVLVELSGTGPQRVVVRAKPQGAAMFRDYDVAREHLVLSRLGALGQPPVPQALALDAPGDVLGRPMLVMRFVAGQVPGDSRPSFAEAGWLFEASPAAQRSFCLSLMGAIAAVHSADWRGLGLAPLARNAGQPLRGEIAWYRALHDWGAGPHRHPVIERGFEVLLRSMPTASPPCLLWGDARPANVIARDFKVVALLDWELAGIGPVELDVAWLIEMNRMRTIGLGVTPLPGFLSDDETVEAYRRLAGRDLGDLAWYRLFAAVKMAVLMERHLRVAIARGQLAPDHRLLTDNVALRRLKDLAEMAATG